MKYRGFAGAVIDASVRETGAELSSGELPVVMGDRSQLVQLLLNLIGNSLKYCGDRPPRVYVSAERIGNEWKFAVKDNGIGIDARHQERIFELFERLHDQRDYPGTGIGLAVCRRVVHRHGGKIWVESEPNQGSIFYFTIPEAADK
jgi:signal transduction histidine kinase